MTYPGDMTDNNAARAMAARLRAAPDDTYTNAALTELLHQAADLIDDLIGDEYNGPTELHPLTNGTVTVTIDPSHPMAQPLFTGNSYFTINREDGSMEQLDPTTVRRHPEGYYIAEPPGPIEPGRG